MNEYQEEIVTIIEKMHKNGENLIETYSFRIAFHEIKRKNTFRNDWRKVIAECLDEKYVEGLEIKIYDKLSNKRHCLKKLNVQKLRTLYMELITVLDCDGKYLVKPDTNKILFSVERSEK